MKDTVRYIKKHVERLRRRPHVGRHEKLTLLGTYSDVPAKVDTGADSSSVWASDIVVGKDHVLRFKLFAPASPLYTGKVIARKSFKAVMVRSSNGQSEVRYRVKLTTNLAGKDVVMRYTLADRSKNNFPILIGRKSLKRHGFLVDVTKEDEDLLPHTRKNKPFQNKLNQELLKNPYKFYRRHHGKNKKRTR